MRNIINQRLDEFCSRGNLESYREVLEKVFDKIYEANCRISVRDDGGPAIHKFSSEDKKCLIRIPLKKYLPNPIDAIWAILHEFGHHQSGSIDKKKYTKEIQIKREIDAWSYARKELLTHPELIKHISLFDNFSAQCLRSYENDKSYS